MPNACCAHANGRQGVQACLDTGETRLSKLPLVDSLISARNRLVSAEFRPSDTLREYAAILESFRDELADEEEELGILPGHPAPTAGSGPLATATTAKRQGDLLASASAVTSPPSKRPKPVALTDNRVAGGQRASSMLETVRSTQLVPIVFVTDSDQPTKKAGKGGVTAGTKAVRGSRSVSNLRAAPASGRSLRPRASLIPEEEEEFRSEGDD